MKQTIRLSKIIDRETSKGVVSRTEYEEQELDALAMQLAGEVGYTIKQKWWDDTSTKVYSVEKVVVETVEPITGEEVATEAEVVEETPITLTEEEIVACKRKTKKK